MEDQISDLEKARLNVQKAEQKLKAGGCGCFADSLDKKSEQALKHYQIALVIFQREKQYLDAGKCFEEVAFIKQRLGEPNDDDFQEAAYCYSFVDKSKSIKVLENSVKKYQNEGKFQKAGEIFNKMAQYYEEEKDYKTCALFYDKAAENYSLSRNHASKERECRLKYADISIINSLGDWKSYVEIYQNIGKQYLIEPMLKYNAKDMFFKIVCLYILYDVIF